MFQPIISTFYAYQKLILIQLFLVTTTIWQYHVMIYIEQITHPTLNVGFVSTIKIFLKLVDIQYLQECINFKMKIGEKLCNFLVLYRSPIQSQDDIWTKYWYNFSK